MKKLFMTNVHLKGVTLAASQAVIRNMVIDGGISEFDLVRDRNNKHDQHAVYVQCLSFFLGWIPKEINTGLAFAMESGKDFKAELVKVLSHPKHPTKGIIVNIVEEVI